MALPVSGQCQGAQIPIHMKMGAHGQTPVHLCTFPIPVWCSWSEEEDTSGVQCWVDADSHTLVSSLVVSLAFAKAFKEERKNVFIFPLLPFLLPLCPPPAVR